MTLKFRSPALVAFAVFSILFISASSAQAAHRASKKPAAKAAASRDRRGRASASSCIKPGSDVAIARSDTPATVAAIVLPRGSRRIRSTPLLLFQLSSGESCPQIVELPRDLAIGSLAHIFRRISWRPRQ